MVNGAPDIKILTNNTERITYIKTSCQAANAGLYNTVTLWAYPECVNYKVILTVKAKIQVLFFFFTPVT